MKAFVSYSNKDKKVGAAVKAALDEINLSPTCWSESVGNAGKLGPAAFVRAHGERLEARLGEKGEYLSSCDYCGYPEVPPWCGSCELCGHWQEVDDVA